MEYTCSFSNNSSNPLEYIEGENLELFASRTTTVIIAYYIPHMGDAQD